MKAAKLRPALLFLVVSVAAAQVYKWVDEQGKTHFGDRPPETADAQELKLPQGPSDEEIAAAEENLRKSLEARKTPEPSQQPGKQEPGADDAGEARSTAELRSIKDGELVCFTPLSAFVAGESAKQAAPITPTQLTDEESKVLKNLFGNIGRNWRGEIVDVTCEGSASEWSSHSLVYDVKTVVDWDSRDSRLVVESDSAGKINRTVKQLFHNYKVDDGLYIRDGRILSQGWSNITVEGNRVQILMLERGRMAFLIKRRAQRNHWISEIRYLESRRDKLMLRQVYFSRGLLTGWRNWLLKRQ